MGKGKGGGKSRSSSSGKKIPVRTVLLSTLWVAAVLFTGVCLILVLNMPPRTEQARQDATGREASKSPSEKTVTPDDPPPALEPGVGGDRAYEEQLGGLMRAVEQIDLAIVQSLSSCGVNADKLRHLAIDFRKEGGKKYHFQEVELRVDPEKGRQILQELEKLLASWLPEAELESTPGTRHSWRIRLRKVVTHRIALSGVISREELPEPAENGPRIALVMDDMGNSLERAHTLLSLFEESIALSVLPQSRYSKEIARVASDKGADVLLHLPMEPKDYPETDPGPGALFVDMSAERIRSVMKQDLHGIPGLVGVNNHMGSRFTTVRADMRQVFSVLRRQDLFYMDSLTSSDSVGEGLASRMGVETINRDIFLDNEKKVKSIRLQLNKAEHLARKVGHAVVTGHPYPQTVEALRLWLADKDKDIKLCRLSSLVQAENDSQAERREEYGTADSGDY